jgi:hypothetical protein
MAEDEDLEVLGAVIWATLATASEATSKRPDHEVEEVSHRSIVPGPVSSRIRVFDPHAPRASGLPAWHLIRSGRERSRKLRCPDGHSRRQVVRRPRAVVRTGSGGSGTCLCAAPIRCADGGESSAASLRAA